MTTQFGKELKKLRIDLGITLMEMAQKINVSSAFLSAIETGRKRIPDGTLNVLAAEFPAIAKERNKFEVLVNQARQGLVCPLVMQVMMMPCWQRLWLGASAVSLLKIKNGSGIS